MKRTVLIAIALIIPMFTIACNTMEGMGEDIQKGGKKIEKEANENK